MNDSMKQFWLLFTITMVMYALVVVNCCRADELVDIDVIIQIESSGNPNAYNKGSGAIGLMQITPIVLKEFLQRSQAFIYYDSFFDPDTFVSPKGGLWNPNVNRTIGSWYLRERIPQMLRYFKKPVTLENVLICYNAGINYVVKGLPTPRETINYIKKYKKLKVN